MQRRALLAGLGASCIGLLAGCLGDDDDNPGNDESPLDGFECEAGDADEPIQVDAFPGVDEPPHDIHPYESDEIPEADWDMHYLGQCMDTEPSLSFDELDSIGSLSDEVELPDNDPLYRVDFATTEDEAAEVWTELPEEVTAKTFDDHVLILIQHGWYSGSLRSHWMRVEQVDDGLHAHGYRRDPVLHDANIELHVSVLSVEASDHPIDRVTASLTRSRDTRLHFTSNDGIVDASELG